MSLLSLYIISKIPVIKGVFLAGGIVGGLIAAIGYIEYLGDKDKYPRLVVVDDFASDAKYKMKYIIDELKKKNSPNYKIIEENIGFIYKNIDHLVGVMYDQLDERRSYGKHIMFWLILFSLMITIGILLPDKELIEQAMEMYK